MSDLNHVSTGDPHVAAHNEERDAINANTTDIVKKINKPTNPPTGALLRYDGDAWVSAATRLLEGHGQPEGEVSAPKGSRYIDLDGTAGAVEFVKVSGTGNTGWLLLVADTGWRDVTNLVDKRGTGTCWSALLRRSSFMVELYLDLTVPNNDTTPWTVMNLPSGFRPDFGRFGTMRDNNGQAASGSVVAADDGAVNLFNPVRQKRDRFTGLWTTMVAWPSSLPGSPWP